MSLPVEVREKICAAGLKIGREVNYRNAGTVEFLVDGETNEFFFIEVNQRIQVEHTATEIITGTIRNSSTVPRIRRSLAEGA